MCGCFLGYIRAISSTILTDLIWLAEVYEAKDSKQGKSHYEPYPVVVNAEPADGPTP